MAMPDTYDGDGFEFSVRGCHGYGKRILVHVTRAALLCLGEDAGSPGLLAIFNAHAQELSLLALQVHEETGLERIVLSPTDLERAAWQLVRQAHSPYERTS
jgi:hypothetical protein